MFLAAVIEHFWIFQERKALFSWLLQIIQRVQVDAFTHLKQGLPTSGYKTILFLFLVVYANSVVNAVLVNISNYA